MIIIDRFEGNKAVLEADGQIIEIDRELIPENAAEGDVLYISDSGYTVDSAATEARRTVLRERLRKLRGKGND
ncbi:MAG: DUF3006 domain-containing protein [Ruminococcus sp.]|nr:DUF3006 domain-containing protein [Oscillospiraceae bacterium]